MSFLRPDALRLLRRWKAVGLALGVLAASAWMTLRGLSSESVLLSGIGIVALLSAGLVSAALVQRLRFRRRVGQGGLVEVDEREIRYFGAEGVRGPLARSSGPH